MFRGMMGATLQDTVDKDARPPWWRNVRVLGWLFQIAIAGAAIGLVVWLLRNFQNNSKTSGIPTGFDYLDQPANFPIAGSSFRPSQSVWDATIVGLRNTIYVVVVGIVLATVLGILVGIARLSQNWLLSRAATVYVETLRNIPLLAIITFAYLALVLSVFPRIENAWYVGDVAIISNRAAAVPWFEGSAWWLAASLIAGLLAAWLAAKWRQNVSDRSGAPSLSAVWGVAAFILVAAIVWAVGGLGVTTPSLDGRKLTGGMEVGPEYLALLVALTIYTASHIAEIVRGSIQAVDSGQSEAASALALGAGQRMTYIVLPQAMRIAIPPLGNQYLNLFKNSSLGVVISYFELTKVTTTAVGNGQPAVPAFALLMLIYLIGSLIISRVVNIGNKRLQLVDR
jgi:general L-amino acid transport system permease protein